MPVEARGRPLVSSWIVQSHHFPWTPFISTTDSTLSLRILKNSNQTLYKEPKLLTSRSKPAPRSIHKAPRSAFLLHHLKDTRAHLLSRHLFSLSATQVTRWEGASSARQPNGRVLRMRKPPPSTTQTGPGARTCTPTGAGDISRLCSSLQCAASLHGNGRSRSGPASLSLSPLHLLSL